LPGNIRISGIYLDESTAKILKTSDECLVVIKLMGRLYELVFQTRPLDWILGELQCDLNVLIDRVGDGGICDA
jgi:hypothetical protein